MSSVGTVGFWGHPDALQDWCEPNYAITLYVAEFFNTITSIPMIVLGLIGIYYCNSVPILRNEKRYTLCFVALTIVGIGSVMFHGSLRWHFQLLDELPMMVGNYIFVYVIIESKKKAGSPTNWLCVFIFSSIALTCSIGYAFFQLWFLFIGSYVFGVLLQWIFFYPYLIDRSMYSIGALATFLIGYYVGLVLWMIDLHHCKSVQSYHFHSLWHIGAGYGTYIWVIIMVMVRIKILKMDKEFELKNPSWSMPIYSIQRVKDHIV